MWAFYPESNQRTLEEMDLLFAADSPWVWEAEKSFARLRAENPDITAGHDNPMDPEIVYGEKDGVSVSRQENIVNGLDLKNKDATSV